MFCRGIRRSVHSSHRLWNQGTTPNASSKSISRRISQKNAQIPSKTGSEGPRGSYAAAVLSGLAIGSTLFYLLEEGAWNWTPTHRHLLLEAGAHEDKTRPQILRMDQDDAMGQAYGGGADFGMIFEGVSEDLSESIIETHLWKNAGSFCPPENDKTGIARVDGTSVATHNPPEEMLTTSFAPLPTHTWAFFGLFDGENGFATSNFLSNTLLIALAGSLADLMTKYDPSEGSTDDGLGYGTTPGEYLDTGPDANVIPFTPDIVRPSLPSHEIDEAIRQAFLRFDDYLVFEATDNFIQSVERRRAESKESQSKGFKEEAVHTLREAESGSSALVGFYESDTRMYRVALAGDSRAVLGRPTVNPSYKPSSNPTPSPSPTRSADPPSPKTNPQSSPWWNSLPSSLKSNVESEPPLEPLSRSDYQTLYEVKQLTSEHVPSNPSERSRIRSLFPADHRNLFLKDNSYLGINTTRGFGYGALKWTLDVQEHLHREFLGDTPPSFFTDGTVPPPPGTQISHTLSHPSDLPTLQKKTTLSPDTRPSYLTAEPEVTGIQVQPGDFIILGTKGLWECLSNEEVVGLVGVWLEERKRVRNEGPRDGKSLSGSSSRNDKEQPVSMRDPKSLLRWKGPLVNGDSEDPDASMGGGDGITVTRVQTALGWPLQSSPTTQYPPSRLVSPSELPISKSTRSEASGFLKDGWRWWKTWRVPKSTIQFVLEGKDLESVSVHVVRNALGGADRDLRGALLGMVSPKCEKFRDDVSVQIVFFE